MSSLADSLQGLAHLGVKEKAEGKLLNAFVPVRSAVKMSFKCFACLCHVLERKIVTNFRLVVVNDGDNHRGICMTTATGNHCLLQHDLGSALVFFFKSRKK